MHAAGFNARSSGRRCAGARARLPLAALLLVAAAPAARAQSDTPTFDQVGPLFQARCIICHSGPGAPLGLRLDSLEGVLAGSKNGKVVVAGAPGQSELLRRVRGESQPRMPLTGPPWLEPESIAMLEAWVTAGMPGGAGAAAPAPAAPKLPAPGEPVNYVHVAPILLQRCVKCHGDQSIMGRPPEGLRLGSYQQVLAGGERQVVVPGAPSASELVRRIRGQSLPRMPFDGPPFLDDEQIRLISDWIAQGARDAAGNRGRIRPGAQLRLEGVLSARWRLDDLELVVGPGTRIDKNPSPGDRVEVRGTLLEDGRLSVQRIRRR